MELLRKNAQKIRFAIVGGANTALDFLVLFILVGLGLDRIASNFVSTSVALVFSFFVNKSFTFKSKDGSARKQFGLFLAITLFGLWVLQPIVILATEFVLSGTNWNEAAILFIGKFLATLVTLVWNYVLYARFVFKKKL